MSRLLLNEDQQRKMFRYFTPEGVERVICPQEVVTGIDESYLPTRMVVELKVEGEPKPLLNGHVQEFKGMPMVGQLDRHATVIMYESDDVSTASYKAGEALLEKLFRRSYFLKYLKDHISVSAGLVDNEWVIKVTIDITDENQLYPKLIETFKPLVVFFRDDMVYVKPTCEITKEEAQSSILSNINHVVYLYSKDVEDLFGKGVEVDTKIIVDRNALINYRIYMKTITQDVVTMDDFRRILVDETHALANNHKKMSFGGQEEMDMILLASGSTSNLHHTPMKVYDGLTFGMVHYQEISASLKSVY